jgi:hypothetical protein
VNPKVGEFFVTLQVGTVLLIEEITVLNDPVIISCVADKSSAAQILTIEELYRLSPSLRFMVFQRRSRQTGEFYAVAAMFLGSDKRAILRVELDR